MELVTAGLAVIFVLGAIHVYDSRARIAALEKRVDSLEDQVDHYSDTIGKLLDLNNELIKHFEGNPNGKSPHLPKMDDDGFCESCGHRL